MKKVVKINRERGYGNQMWLVLYSFDSLAYRLRSIDNRKEQITMFKAHCYEDLETRKMSFQIMEDQAKKLGV